MQLGIDLRPSHKPKNGRFQYSIYSFNLQPTFSISKPQKITMLTVSYVPHPSLIYLTTSKCLFCKFINPIVFSSSAWQKQQQPNTSFCWRAQGCFFFFWFPHQASLQHAQSSKPYLGSPGSFLSTQKLGTFFRFHFDFGKNVRQKNWSQSQLFFSADMWVQVRMNQCSCSTTLSSPRGTQYWTLLFFGSLEALVAPHSLHSSMKVVGLIFNVPYLIQFLNLYESLYLRRLENYLYRQ